MDRLTIIARCDLTGLGVQSRNWVRLLSPSKVVVINSKPFNGNVQYPEVYDDYSTVHIDGFIKPHEISRVLEDTDILLTFEIDYTVDYSLVAAAKKLGIKTVVIANYEFADWLQRPHLPRPDIIANHSSWKNDEFEQAMGVNIPVLRTPTFVGDYSDVYGINSRRQGTPRFLHVAGRKTHLDRNGTQSVIDAVSLVPDEIEFELVIQSQTVSASELRGGDRRIIFTTQSPKDERDLYRDYDAMILPRRYAGGCLPMQEALAAGLPVIMTDISPNNDILPPDWLVLAQVDTSFMARTRIDVYSADRQKLALSIEKLAEMSNLKRSADRAVARSRAIEFFSPGAVLTEWGKVEGALRG